METQIEDIAKYIFTLEPKNPNSIQLLSDEVDNEYIFEMLLNLLLEGLYILYGNTFNISDLNENILMKLNTYFHSIGFSIQAFSDKKEDCFCHVIKTDFEKPFIFVLNFNNKTYNNLSDYYVDLGDTQLNFKFFSI